MDASYFRVAEQFRNKTKEVLQKNSYIHQLVLERTRGQNRKYEMYLLIGFLTDPDTLGSDLDSELAEFGQQFEIVMCGIPLLKDDADMLSRIKIHTKRTKTWVCFEPQPLPPPMPPKFTTNRENLFVVSANDRRFLRSLRISPEGL